MSKLRPTARQHPFFTGKNRYKLSASWFYDEYTAFAGIRNVRLGEACLILADGIAGSEGGIEERELCGQSR
jgi:hypothetical protein